MSVPEGQERDVLPMRRILGVGIGAIAIGAAATAWSAHIDQPDAPQVAHTAPPAAMVHVVEDTLYDPERSATETRVRQRAQLSTWSWADRDRRLVNLPIDQAMDLWLARHAPPDGDR